MNVMILGAGKVGSLIARKLSELGHSVTVVEKNPKAVSLLPMEPLNSGDMKIIFQDGATGPAMIKAGIENTDVFIAATGKDSLNGLAAQRAQKVFGVARVLATVNNEDTKRLYESLDIFTINKANIVSNQIVNHITEGQ